MQRQNLPRLERRAPARPDLRIYWNWPSRSSALLFFLYRFQSPNRQAECRAHSQREQNFRGSGGEDENESLPLDQRGKARNKKRHHIEPSHLPGPELVAVRGGTDVERC